MITGNEPAMPTKHYNINGSMDKQCEGLTIRQQFAMYALNGILASNGTTYSSSDIKEAVYCADALIAELNRTESDSAK